MQIFISREDIDIKAATVSSNNNLHNLICRICLKWRLLENIHQLNNKEWCLLGCTQRNIPEDTILYSHRRENLKSYTVK
jgi:hypothetical protein